jgi:hypothetical protein
MTDEGNTTTTDTSSIVINETRNWPRGGVRTLTSEHQHARDKQQHRAFLARCTPGGSEVWFWITTNAVRGMQPTTATPGERGELLVDSLIAWVRDNPDYQWASRNEFRVVVSADGKATLKLYEPSP